MDETAKLAGFFAAHAVWCVSDGSTLIPIYGLQKPDGSLELHRLDTQDFRQGVEHGREWLEKNPQGAPYAILIYDGFVTLPSGKIDALLIDAHMYNPHKQVFLMALPYHHAKSPSGFAVHRPKLMSFGGTDEELDPLIMAFFDGVGQHEKGAEVWNDHLDESL
jgi:hypothetical protein